MKRRGAIIINCVALMLDEEVLDELDRRGGKFFADRAGAFSDDGMPSFKWTFGDVIFTKGGYEESELAFNRRVLDELFGELRLEGEWEWDS